MDSSIQLPSIESVLDNISDTFSVIDRQWRILYANKAALAALGKINKADIIGKNVWEEFGEFVGSDLHQKYIRSMEEGVKISFTSYYEPLDMWTETDVHPFENGIAIYGRDISERMRAERESTLLLERLRLAIDATNLGTWDMDPTTHALKWNRVCKRLFGFDEEDEVTYEKFQNAIVEEDRIAVDAAAANALDPVKAMPYEIEFRFRKADGSLRWASTRGKAVFEGEGEARHATRFIGTVLDITDRRTRQVQLEEQREWLRVTLSSIGDAVITTDTGGRVTFLNPVAEQMTGWKNDEAIQKQLTTVFRIMNEQTHEPQENPVERVLSTGTIVGLANHTVLVSKDGQETPIEDSAAPIRTSDGEVTGVVLVFHDASEQRRVEELTKRSARRISKILEGIGEAFMSLDREWNLTFVNDRAARILNLMKGETLEWTGRNLWSEFPDLIWTEAYEKYHHAIRTQKPVEFQADYGAAGGMHNVRAFPSLEGLSVFFSKVQDNSPTREDGE